MTQERPAGRVVIVGGGLAGMIAANELTRRGVEVLILERSMRTGGKAGADLINRSYEEHGYHIFPAWYRNIHALLDEIGASKNLTRIERFHYWAPLKGDRQRKVEVRQFDSVASVLHNIFHGIIPWYEIFLGFYSLVDLCSRPFDENKHYLDRISVNGFLRERWYASNTIASYQHQTVLQASSIPAYDLSAMTVKHLVQHWSKKPAPLFQIMNGNLQEKFIAPLEKHLLSQPSFQLRLGTQVKRLETNGQRITGLVLKYDGRTYTEPLAENDCCILATPIDATCRLLSDRIFDAERRNAGHAGNTKPLASIHRLESAPMAAFHFYLNRKIAGLPAEHVNLYGSEYNTSFVDVSQHWDELKGGPTVLSAIVSDFTNLRQLSSAKVAACVLEDLRRFIPGLSQDDVARVHTQLNVTKPLFVNTVGAWSFRPRAKTRIPNLYIAGDYCRTEADLTTMESAAISGRQTAAQILNDKGMEAAAREAAPRQLEKRSERSFRGLWWLLLPFAGCAWLARSLDSKRGRLLG